jgi:hypothetical protein
MSYWLASSLPFFGPATNQNTANLQRVGSLTAAIPR